MQITARSFVDGKTQRQVIPSSIEEIEITLITGERLIIGFEHSDGQIVITGTTRVNILPLTECQLKVELRKAK